MKFVSDHLTKHHLTKRPHRWLTAFVLSPIHAAEMHYKRRYHMTFVHAKKVFLFDMALLASIVVLIAGIVFWFTYDPTVTKYVSLSIAPSVHDEHNHDGRIRSGEHVEYTVSFKNESEVTLTDAALQFHLPNGFVIDEGSRRVPLGELAPGAEATHTLSGFFYEDVACEHHVTAVLLYMQDGRRFTEQKHATIIQTLRGSVVTSEISGPETVLSSGTYPFTITLTNSNHHTIDRLELDLTHSPELRIEASELSHGEVIDGVWQLSDLDPNASATLTGSLVSAITNPGSERTMTLTPNLVVGERRVAQVPVSHSLFILRPEASLSAVWESEGAIQPGQSATLLVTMQNTGTTELTDLSVLVDLPSEVDRSGVAQANAGSFVGNRFALSPTLDTLAPGATETVRLELPVRLRNSGTDVALQVPLQLRATVPTISGSQYTSPSIQSSPIGIGSMIFISAESRYYTAEGDQLGRGPLPPRVGEETKYWAFISVQNTTSRVRDLSFSATLPAGVVWTGRSSVSHGKDLVYTSASRAVNWSIASFPANSTAGIFMELAIVPTAEQRGTTPRLLEGMAVRATDTATDAEILRSHLPIDSSLPADDIAQTKGVTIQ